MAIAEDKDNIVLLHRVQPGSLGRSYGIQVARLAGMPEHIVQRANELLAILEATRGLQSPANPDCTLQSPPLHREGTSVAERRTTTAYTNGHVPSSSLAPVPPPLLPRHETREQEATDLSNDVLDELLCVDIATMTPLEALNRLFALQQRARRHYTRSLS
jgi:DNA mismatch repair protein MutS